MAEPRATFSVLILARNEAERILRCLEQVAWADDIVVVDDLSTDDTADICRRAGARVVQRRLDTFANQANFGLTHARGDWVILLDADDLMTPELSREIDGILRDDRGCQGYTFKRMNFYLGHRMRFGGWHHDIARLFRRTSGRFIGDVHLDLEVGGRMGRLQGHVEHYPFHSVSQFINRQNRYSSMEADELVRRGAPSEQECRRQITLKPAKLWWKLYVKKQGFREGGHGVVFTVLFAWVHFLKWAKCWERLQASAAPRPGPAEAAQGDRRPSEEVLH